MTATLERAWTRLLQLRMTGCRELHIQQRRLVLAGGIRGSARELVERLGRLDTGLEVIARDLDRLAAGDLGAVLEAPRDWSSGTRISPRYIRQAHCRSSVGPRDRRRRRRFPVRILRATTLTQPEDTCGHCGRRDPFGRPLDLDHIVELVAGGADAPYNLERLCEPCHREKPYFPDLDDLIDYRFRILDWLASPCAYAERRAS